MTTLAVAYAGGAVTPGDILRSLTTMADLVFVTDGSDPTRALRPLFESAGNVVELTGDSAADIAAVRAYQPDGIVTYCETMIRPAAEIADALGLRFHTPATARLLTDKYMQRHRLTEAGVDAIAFARVDTHADIESALDRVPMPAIVKPVHGAASRDTHAVRDAGECRDLLTRLLAAPGSRSFIVEQFLVGEPVGRFGDYVSVESVVTPAGPVHFGVTGKLPMLWPFRETGQIAPAPVHPHVADRAVELTSAALQALGLTYGITHTELKLTPQGPRIIEVNGRIGGNMSELYGRATGADLVRIAAEIALGVPVSPVGPARPGVFFNSCLQPPVEARELLAVQGGPDHPHVRHRPFARPGFTMPTTLSTCNLDLFTGWAADHDEMEKTLEACVAELTYVFRTDDGERSYGGLSLLRQRRSDSPAGGRV